MLRALRHFLPGAPGIRGMHQDVIARALRPRRWGAENDSLGLLAADELYVAEIRGDIPPVALAFRPSDRERRACVPARAARHAEREAG